MRKFLLLVINDILDFFCSLEMFGNLRLGLSDSFLMPDWRLLIVPVNFLSYAGVSVDFVHDYAMALAYGISLFVFVLILFYSFNHFLFKTFVEHKTLEFIWTIIPGFILLSILIPSISGLYSLDYTRFKKIHENIVVFGRQWYWSYKFLPRRDNNQLCFLCKSYEDKADQYHYHFDNQTQVGNVLMPYWTKQTRKDIAEKNYWISPTGGYEGVRMPKRMSRVVFKEGHYSSMVKVNNWFFANRKHGTYRVTPKQFQVKVPEEEFKNLHDPKVMWELPNFIPKRLAGRYVVDSYQSQSQDLSIFRNLDADNSLVLPTKKLLRFHFWSRDVIHSFAIPDLSLKLDCVPGRLNKAFSIIHHPGKYYGQCSELCGANHSFMPSRIHSFLQNIVLCSNTHYTTNYDYWWDNEWYRQWAVYRIGSWLGYKFSFFHYWFNWCCRLTQQEWGPSSFIYWPYWLAWYKYLLSWFGY